MPNRETDCDLYMSNVELTVLAGAVVAESYNVTYLTGLALYEAFNK